MVKKSSPVILNIIFPQKSHYQKALPVDCKVCVGGGGEGEGGGGGGGGGGGPKLTFSNSAFFVSFSCL